MLDIQNLSKTFNPGTVNEKKALSFLSLHLDEGDFVTIVGSNGAGKSTLFNAIAGSFYADEGSISLAGKDITFMPEHERSRCIGRLFQDPLRGTAPSMTIEENLALAYLRAAHGNPFSRISKKDKEFFAEQLKQLDMGLEDRMKNPVGLLSGGQRQALTLLMATMVPPQLLLLDEHTAALDPATAEKVLNLRLRQGGGRFVKDDDLGVEGNRLRNFDHLPLRNRHRAHHGSRVDVDPQIVKDFLRIVVALLVGDKRQSLFDQRIASQPNVIHDRALERLIQLLVNHGNAVVQRFSGGFEVDLFTVEVNVTGVFGINAEQTLHQRRFSRAVLTHQGVNRSRSHGKLRIIQRLYTGETLADALHTKKYVLFHVCASPFRQKTALRPVLPTH